MSYLKLWKYMYIYIYIYTLAHVYLLLTWLSAQLSTPEEIINYHSVVGQLICVCVLVYFIIPVIYIRGKYYS